MNQNNKTVNEPVKSYDSGSAERKKLQEKYDQMANQIIEIPLIIGGKEIKTGKKGTCVMPHNHQHILATYHKAEKKEVERVLKGWVWKNYS